MYLDCSVNSAGLHWIVGRETASGVSAAGCLLPTTVCRRRGGYTCLKAAPNDVGANVRMPLSFQTSAGHAFADK